MNSTLLPKSLVVKKEAVVLSDRLKFMTFKFDVTHLINVHGILLVGNYLE